MKLHINKTGLIAKVACFPGWFFVLVRQEWLGCQSAQRVHGGVVNPITDVHDECQARVTSYHPGDHSGIIGQPTAA
jgi:hypothetical protein